MNPFSTGMPSELSVIIKYTTAKFGIGVESPPNSEISRVCRRSYSTPTSRNSAPVEMP